MFRCTGWFGLAVAGLAATTAPAARAAYDAIRVEQSCPKDREPHSLRQTIIVLDEAIVGGPGGGTQGWKRIVIEAADAKGDVSLGIVGPRERVTILLARRDGSELVPLFLACSPNLSSDEVARSRTRDGILDDFLGTGTEDRLRKSRDTFATGIAKALAQVDRGAEAAGGPVPVGGLLRALRNAGQMIDLNHGIPRLVIVSPFRIVEPMPSGTVPEARDAGFRMAEQHGIDLGRAEVYLAGATLPAGPALEFARAVFLGSKDGWPEPAPTAYPGSCPNRRRYGPMRASSNTSTIACPSSCACRRAPKAT